MTERNDSTQLYEDVEGRMSRPSLFTVCILEPCCEKTEPGYVPRSKPYYVRTPGWSDSCRHPKREWRKATLTTYETRAAAEEEYYGKAGSGWYTTDGWLFEGQMPPEGERFRIMPIVGTSTSHHEHGRPVEIPFPAIEMAREYAEEYHEYPDSGRRKQSLYNIVGDRDTVVRWSSYDVEVGTELTPGDWA
ncbi:hypothetical protein [Streptomyces rimosus]|uniref:hypothetical protein n=1 Tax=Streptomyces rimosus TaxID=1927 RepID=UPI0004CA0253|nr:hypothetical protein [Streptomyces rimosus]